MSDIVIVDFSWLFYRSFHAFQDLEYKRGNWIIKTGGMFGCLRELKYAYDKFQCMILVAIEPPDNTARTSLFEEYKADRDRPDDISVCWDDTIKAAALFPFVKIVSAKAGEADDVIYSLAQQCIPHCDRVLLKANDNDLLQIGEFEEAQSKVHFLGSKNSLISITDKSQKAFPDVTGRSLAMFRSICGDKSDNLDGPIQRFPKRVASIIAEKFETPGQCVSLMGDMSPVMLARHFGNDKTAHKYLALLLQKFTIWDRNYQIMKLRPVEVIYPEIDHILVGDLVEMYGMISMSRMLSNDPNPSS